MQPLKFPKRENTGILRITAFSQLDVECVEDLYKIVVLKLTIRSASFLHKTSQKTTIILQIMTNPKGKRRKAPIIWET